MSLGDGDNALTVNDSWFPGPFNAKTGSGADVVTIGGDSVFTNSVSVQTGSGADAVVIDDSVFTGMVNLATGAGPDAVEIETKIGTTASTEFEGPVTISLGADGDTLTLGQPETLEGMVVLIDSTFVVHHGAGADRQFIADGHVDFPFGTSLQWVV